MDFARVQAPAKAPYSNDGFDCAICWESFNNDQHCPFSLWCGHTLCKECVHRLPWAKISTFSVPVQLPCVIACPWCTWLTPRLVCTGGLRYPCKNYSLLWLVESIPRARSPSLTPTDSPPLLHMSPFRPPLPPTPSATAPLPPSLHSLSTSPLVPAFRSAWRAGGSVATQRPPGSGNSSPRPSGRPPPSSHSLPHPRSDPHPEPPSLARVVEPVAATGRAVAVAAAAVGGGGGGGGGGGVQMGLGFELFLGLLVLLLTCASMAVRTIRKLPLVLMLSFIVLCVLPVSGAVTAIHFLLSFFFAIPSSAIMVLCIYYAEWLVLRIMD